MTLIRLILSGVFMHALLSNPNRQGDNKAFVTDALSLADDLIHALNPEEPTDE